MRIFLDSIGIQSFIPDETTSLMLPNQFFHAPGVDVQVNEDDLKEAGEALKEFNHENAGATLNK